MSMAVTSASDLLRRRALLFPLLLSVIMIMWMWTPESMFKFNVGTNGLPSKQQSNVNRRRWIVVTTVQVPTENLKRLSRTLGWSLVVVGDTRTPKNWSLGGVDYLSVDNQKKLGFLIHDLLPYKSYTRKNIGYLYAIMNGAEWIYDTDDDKTPYGHGLDQFDFTQHTSGLRYGCRSLRNNTESNSISLSAKMFNPYEFFGRRNMWPRGFPVEFLQGHKNGQDQCCLCHKMKTAAVQQGLVHKDPDLDAIYRLLNVDSKSGMNESFSKQAAPVTLASGIYAPWNSQNTLFHRNAFFTLLLPVNVSSSFTAIWRSYFSQKLLHMVGESVAFYPENAIHFGNRHNHLGDFEKESDVYLKAGKLVEFLDQWKCSEKEIDRCAIKLARDLSTNGFWKDNEVQLVVRWMEDLKSIGYVFPKVRHTRDYRTPLHLWRGENCRPANFDFISEPAFYDEINEQSFDKVRGFGELADYCSGASHSDQLHTIPSLRQINEDHMKRAALTRLRTTVLVITSNYPFNATIGTLQRLYQPYFGLTIFCGPWYPERYADNTGLPKMLQPFNYIHLSEVEMVNGYYAYYCLSKVKDLRLKNVNGYFVIADDNVFNFWHELDLNNTIHSMGFRDTTAGPWWGTPMGMKAAIKAVRLFEDVYKDDEEVQAVFDEYRERLVSVLGHEVDASEQIKSKDEWAISDFYYIPAHLLDYHAGLMEIFFKAEMFHEIAIAKFLHTVPHDALKHSKSLMLWGDGREKWYKRYHENLVAFHPIKFSYLHNKTFRHRFCNTVLSAFWKNLINPKS